MCPGRFYGARHRLAQRVSAGYQVCKIPGAVGAALNLITGNPRHFPKFWKKTKIITSREFIGIVGPHLLS